MTRQRTSAFLNLLPFVPAFFVATACPAKAEESVFAYSEGAETQSAGHVELSQWVTQRTGKADGRFQASDFITEIEYGVTDRLQTSLYLTSAHGINLDEFERNEVRLRFGFDF